MDENLEDLEKYQMLQEEYLVPNIGFDTAEIEPLQVGENL